MSFAAEVTEAEQAAGAGAGVHVSLLVRMARCARLEGNLMRAVVLLQSAMAAMQRAHGHSSVGTGTGTGTGSPSGDVDMDIAEIRREARRVCTKLVRAAHPSEQFSYSL